MLFVLKERDLPGVGVALKSNALFLFNLIVLRLLVLSEHFLLHFNHISLESGSCVALGAVTRNVLTLLLVAFLVKNTSHAYPVTTEHWHWKLSISAKSALATDTFIFRRHFIFNFKIYL